MTVTFTCADAETGIASCTAPATFATEGTFVASGSAVDKAGNRSDVNIDVRVDLTPPQLTLQPVQAQTRADVATITGTVVDALSGVRGVTCRSVPATVTGNSFTCAAPLLVGFNSIEVKATDQAGNATSQIVSVRLDKTPPEVTVDAPADGSITSAGMISVSGSVFDNDQVASVSVGPIAAAVDNNRFEAMMPLVDGSNPLTVTATDRAGNQSTASLTVQRFAVASIAISSPADLLVTSSSTTDVTGSVSDSSAQIVVNGVSAVVSGTTFRAVNVPLAQGRTVITAVATGLNGHTATNSINVYRDSIPPRVLVNSPAGGATLTQPAIDVVGMVDDVVVGTINAGQVQVTVNGIAAQVMNRSFVARNVPLTAGLNTLLVTATDQGSNTASVKVYVTYNPTPSLPTMVITGGNAQSATIGSALASPLSIRVIATNGQPVAGKQVMFSVLENNGSLTAASGSGRKVSAITDAQGNATAQWTLGTRAGAGNNRVRATAPGVAAGADFSAVALPGPAALIVVDSGNRQLGAVSSTLSRPLVAVVVDRGSNRLGGIPVTFAVSRGGGSFDGQASTTVSADGDGRAIVRPLIGIDAGADNNVFVASVAGVENPATFIATGIVAGAGSATTISGVVVDNTNIAIPGVSVRIEGTSLQVQSDGQGQFAIAGVPIGYVKLLIDGSTAQRPGTWPTLEYAIYTVPGQNNTLGMPIYLLPIDVAHGLFVDETHGGTLSLAELPGFSLNIAPGSVTFPGGSRTGTISATLVHPDKMPMPPGFGQQPRFLITIQPPGAHFEPPAAMTLPNVDGLAPGEVTELYSFDHDLGQFVAIGTGSVSDDGSIIRSDPGVGIIKAGWHCGGNPQTSGTTANCGANNQSPSAAPGSPSALFRVRSESISSQCSTLNAAGNACVPNPAANGQPCSGDGNPCTEDVCSNGACAHNPLRIAVNGPPPYRNEWVNKDKPTLVWADRENLNEGTPVYSSDVVGDMVKWKAYIENVSYRSKVASYTWWADNGPERKTGPTGPQASEWFVTNMDWKPGTYTITCKIVFNTGCEKTTNFTQEIGVRSHDITLVGWINPCGVPLSGSGVSWQVLNFFPIGGFRGLTETEEVARQQAATGIYMFVLSQGYTLKPLSNDILTLTDRSYILNWLFKYGANYVCGEPPFNQPPDNLSPDSVMNAFMDEDLGYKLFNRMQIKYLVQGTKVRTYEFLHQDRGTRIGTTLEPVLGLPDTGVAGTHEKETGVLNADLIYQINDGTPARLAVELFDALMFPLRWSHIGSIIKQGASLGSGFDFATQNYPTYFVYEDGIRNPAKTHFQAPEPRGAFSLNPYPPGPAPFIP